MTQQIRIPGWVKRRRVVAPTYGDGTTDATTAIQGRLDAAADDGGGPVIVPPGVYKISATLYLPHKVHLIGEGSAEYHGASAAGVRLNSVVLKGASGMAEPILEMKQDGPTVFTSYYQQQSLVSGICFDGKDMVTVLNTWGDVQYGLLWSSDVHGLWVQNCSFIDVAVKGLSFRRTIASSIRACSMLRCGEGLYLYSDADDNEISGCQIGTCTAGMRAVGGSLLRIFGNKIYNNGSTAGLTIDGQQTNSSYGNTISGNNIDDNSGDGIFIKDSIRNTISGNTCTRNGNAGIRLGGTIQPASYNTVTANSCINIPSGTKQDYGIKVDDNSDYNTFVGNICEENATSNWLVSSTGTSHNRFSANPGQADA